MTWPKCDASFAGRTLRVVFCLTTPAALPWFTSGAGTPTTNLTTLMRVSCNTGLWPMRFNFDGCDNCTAPSQVMCMVFIAKLHER